MMNNRICVALMGNPNCGKTTIFNYLTGSRQHVGNWPGKTVEKREGNCTHNGEEIEIVDLPGTYSLSAYSMEEVVARDFILEEHPDVVVSVVDTCNLERNLYLAVQILELGIPMILALNMTDVAESKGLLINTEMLSRALKSPVIKTTASNGKGISELLDLVVKTARETPK